MVKGTTNFTVCEKKTAVLYLNGAKLKENTVGARHLHVLTETGCGRLAAVFHSYLCCFLRDLLAICVIPLLPVPQLRGHWLRSFFCRARCIGPILSLVDRGGFRTWLTGNSYTGVHNLSLSWRTTTGQLSPRESLRRLNEVMCIVA